MSSRYGDGKDASEFAFKLGDSSKNRLGKRRKSYSGLASIAQKSEPGLYSLQSAALSVRRSSRCPLEANLNMERTDEG